MLEVEQNSPSINFRLEDSSNQKQTTHFRQISYNLSITNKDNSTHKKQLQNLHGFGIYGNNRDRTAPKKGSLPKDIQSDLFFEKFDKFFKVSFQNFAKIQQSKSNSPIKEFAELAEIKSKTLQENIKSHQEKHQQYQIQNLETNNSCQASQLPIQLLPTKKIFRKHVQTSLQQNKKKSIDKIKNKQDIVPTKVFQRKFTKVSDPIKTVKYNGYNKSTNPAYRLPSKGKSENDNNDNIFTKQTCYSIFKQGLRSGTLQNWKRKFHEKMQFRQPQVSKPTIKGRFYKKSLKSKQQQASNIFTSKEFNVCY